MKEKTRRKIKILLGLALITLSFFIHAFYFGRIILAVMGIGYLVMGKGRHYRKNKARKYLLITLCYLISLLLLDTILVFTIKIEPLFTFRKNYDTIIIYNSLGYRAWHCHDDEELIIDPFYQGAFMCDEAKIKPLEINAFSSQIVGSYNDYNNEFVKIVGKISQINGLNDFTMQAYERQNDITNGYVAFADNITLHVIFNNPEEKLANYKLYDWVTVVGRVVSLQEENGKTTIKMVDSELIDHDLYQNYDLVLTSTNLLRKELTKTYSSEQLEIYNEFSTPLMIKFSNQDVYELENVLSSNKLAIKEILAKAKSSQSNYEKTMRAYIYDDFKIFYSLTTEKTIIMITQLDVDFIDLASLTS